MAKKRDSVPEWATHGIITTYQDYGCRCGECVEVNRANKRASYSRNRLAILARQKARRSAQSKGQKPTVIDRFWSNIDKRDDDECWLWTGSNVGQGPKKSIGYGQLWANGRNILAHRLSAMIHFGMFDRRAVVCHTCDVPRCVNPRHLYLGDSKTNAMDRVTHGNQISRRNGNHHATRLTQDQVDEICSLYVPGRGGNAGALASKFGITKDYVSELVRNERRKAAA